MSIVFVSHFTWLVIPVALLHQLWTDLPLPAEFVSPRMRITKELGVSHLLSRKCSQERVGTAYLLSRESLNSGCI